MSVKIKHTKMQTSNIRVAPRAESLNLRRTYAMNIGADGEVSPQQITIGRLGEINTTKLSFDLSALTEIYPNLQHLTYAIILFDPDRPRVSYTPEEIIRNPELKYQINPLTYSIDTTWLIPQEIYANISRYKAVFALIEKENVNGNIQEKEVFVSHEFTLQVISNTLYTTKMYNLLHSKQLWDREVQNYDASQKELNKNFITTTIQQPIANILDPMSVDNANFGVYQDAYIKRLKINTFQELNDMLLTDNLYGVFTTSNTTSVIKFTYNAIDNNWLCWVPKTVTASESRELIWQFGLMVLNTIPTAGEAVSVDESHIQWFSNALTINITNNFLEADDLIIDIDEGYIGLTTNNNEFLLTADELTLVPSDLQ